MYFLEQVKKQLFFGVRAYFEAPAGEGREEMQAASEAVEQADANPEDVAQKADTLCKNLDTACERQAGRNFMEKGEEVDASNYTEAGEGVSKSVEGSQNIEVYNSLIKQPPFDTIPKEEMEALYQDIINEGFEVPEGVTEKEALEEAMNDKLSQEPTEYEERINKVLEDEGIELTKEQRKALGEYLDGIENPNIGNIQEFLKENDLGDMSLSDNPNTAEDESEVPSFLTSLYTTGDSYRGLASRGGSWSGENPYTGEAFEGDAGLNDEFYDVEKLRSELPLNIREQADSLAEEMTQKIESQGGNPENWIGALYRNATNNPDFNANQPVLLHNLSTATACVYINGAAHIVPATHGKGVGNANGMHGTPIGSFQMYGMTNGKYQGRVGVNGLEQMRQNVSNDSTQNMHNQDPASMGNANSDARLIRVHESRGSRTEGCSGLPTPIAIELANTMRSSRIGIMERFVSQPTRA